jgi:hypothetical protein
MDCTLTAVITGGKPVEPPQPEVSAAKTAATSAMRRNLLKIVWLIWCLKLVETSANTGPHGMWCGFRFFQNRNHQNLLTQCSSYFQVLVRMQTPGLLSGVPVNSTPPSSRASLIATKVRMFPFGTPDMTSILLIVAVPIPDLFERSSDDHRNKALAARI